jgi:hypothetical protein
VDFSLNRPISLFLVIFYLIAAVVFAVFSLVAIMHYLRYRQEGDLSLIAIVIFLVYSLFFFLLPFFLLNYSV